MDEILQDGFLLLSVRRGDKKQGTNQSGKDEEVYRQAPSDKRWRNLSDKFAYLLGTQLDFLL